MTVIMSFCFLDQGQLNITGLAEHLANMQRQIEQLNNQLTDVKDQLSDAKEKSSKCFYFLFSVLIHFQYKSDSSLKKNA